MAETHATTTAARTTTRPIPKMLAEFDRRVGDIAQQIAEAQAAHRTIEAELEKARARQGLAASNLALGRHNDQRGVPRLEDVLNAARTDVNRIQALRIASEDHLRTLRDTIHELHRSRRQYLAFGGRDIPVVPMPDIRRGDEL